MTSRQTHIFERSGLAALSDVRHPECQTIFAHLEQEQAAFLAKEADYRSKEYRWPRDPLHCWSRAWEYPYVYYHLQKLFRSKRLRRPIVADVGSGVTFFPFSLARFGCRVVCTDVDPTCDRDLSRAAGVVDHRPGSVEFRLTNGSTLPFDDGECDAVYCISVLEHITDFANTVRELARILSDSGVCVVTCDLSLDGKTDLPLSVDQYHKLTWAIAQGFRLAYPETTVHPRDLLTNASNGRVRWSTYASLPLIFAKQKLAKPLLGKPMGPLFSAVSPQFAAMGLVLGKSSGAIPHGKSTIRQYQTAVEVPSHAPEADQLNQ